MSLTILSVCIFIANTSWISPETPRLPRADCAIAVGYYNDSIWLLGGASNRYQLVQYYISQNAFIDHGSSALSDAFWGWGPGWTQINHHLFMIDPDGDKFFMYDLQSNVFNNYWNNINIPTNVQRYACLASTMQYIFVLGGTYCPNPGCRFTNKCAGCTFTNECQTLHLSTNSWISTPSMDKKRGDTSCIVHPPTNRLYAIGGHNANSPYYLDSVETIFIGGDILNEDWSYNGYNLLSKTAYARSIVHESYIWVIGGASFDGNHYLDKIQIIDTATGIISSGGFLNYAVKATSAIAVNDVVYAFGGQNSDDKLNKWQYSLLYTHENLLTISPTLSPTMNPSNTTKQSIVSKIVNNCNSTECNKHNKHNDHKIPWKTYFFVSVGIATILAVIIAVIAIYYSISMCPRQNNIIRHVIHYQQHRIGEDITLVPMQDNQQYDEVAKAWI